MKKIFLLSLIVLLFTACSGCGDITKEKIIMNNQEYAIERVSILDHDYLSITGNHEHFLVHDPECDLCRVEAGKE